MYRVIDYSEDQEKVNIMKLQFPEKEGTNIFTLATTEDIPDTSSFATLAGDNIFTKNVTFQSYRPRARYGINCGTEESQSTLYNDKYIAITNEDNFSLLELPETNSAAATKLATVNDLPEANNGTGTVTLTSLKIGDTVYNVPSGGGTGDVTAAGDNTFTGSNTFNGTVNIKTAAVSINSTLGSLLLNSAAGVTIQKDTVFDSKQSFVGSGIRYDKASAPGTDDWGETRTTSSATGNQSIAFGGSVHTYADWGVAFGADTRAYMKCSAVSGKGNQAGPRDNEKTTYTVSSTFGNAGNPARSQELTHTWSYGDYADARASGVLNKALGFAADAGNGENIAFGHYSTAKGYQNVAAGDHSTVIGSNNFTSGKLSFSGGNGSISSGEGAVTFGKGTQATAVYATALGEGTIANTSNSIVVGRYNDSTVNNTLLVVGNGTVAQRNNAFVVHGDGRATVFTSPIYNNDVVRLGDLPIRNAVLDSTTSTLTLTL